MPVAQSPHERSLTRPVRLQIASRPPHYRVIILFLPRACSKHPPPVPIWGASQFTPWVPPAHHQNNCSSSSSWTQEDELWSVSARWQKVVCIFKAFSSHRPDHHRDRLTSAGWVCIWAPYSHQGSQNDHTKKQYDDCNEDDHSDDDDDDVNASEHHSHHWQGWPK